MLVRHQNTKSFRGETSLPLAQLRISKPGTALSAQ